MKLSPLVKLLLLLKEGAQGNGLTQNQCEQMLAELIEKKEDFSKPPLSNDYPTRCIRCGVSAIHKNNKSGLCTDCAVHLRCNGQYLIKEG
jgi:hypothetical protein